MHWQLEPLRLKNRLELQLVQAVLLVQEEQPGIKLLQRAHVVLFTTYPLLQMVQTEVLEQERQFERVTLQSWHALFDMAYPLAQPQPG